MRRYVVVGGEPELALLLHIFPEGVEELNGGYAVYADEPPLGFDVVAVDEVDDRWPDAWRDFHHGVRVGALWVGPPWELPTAVPGLPPGAGGLAAGASSDELPTAVPGLPPGAGGLAAGASSDEGPPADVIAVVIDPGRAFGTGSHATTRLCLELLQDAEPGSLLDVGCGSGVLSIAAAKLGFAPVGAFDIDEVALETTAANASANGVDVEILAELRPAGLAVMNIALDVVEAMLPKLEVDRAITSGYLERDEPRAEGWRRRERQVRDGWAADLLQRG